MEFVPRLVRKEICPPDDLPKVAFGLVVPTRNSSMLSTGTGMTGSTPMPDGLTG